MRRSTSGYHLTFWYLFVLLCRVYQEHLRAPQLLQLQAHPHGSLAAASTQTSLSVPVWPVFQTPTSSSSFSDSALLTRAHSNTPPVANVTTTTSPSISVSFKYLKENVSNVILREWACPKTPSQQLTTSTWPPAVPAESESTQRETKVNVSDELAKTTKNF